MSLFRLKNNQKILVEASAGTGKTYSLAILYIKAVLQTKDIRKVLAVTFTEAAVAELKDRVRLFVLHLVQKSDNTLLEKFANENIDQDVLKNMLIEIDNAPIYTIHGFCMQILERFSIDVHYNQLAELNNDQSSIITPLCYDYYRQEIVYNPEKNNIQLEYLLSIANSIGQGIPFAFTDIAHYEREAKRLEQDFDNFKVDCQSINFIEIFNNAKGHLKNFLAKHAITDNHFDQKNAYTQIAQSTTGYITEFKKIFSRTEFIKPSLDYARLIDTLAFIEWFKEKFKTEKPKYPYYTYDDLINDVHQAIQNPLLAQKIGDLFPYVFIDEFQDTDAKQYAIFKQCFIENRPQHTVYLIGDPKQAIYGFRGADIDAYLEAKSDISPENRITLDTNYRSTKDFIANQNTIFEAFNRDGNFFLKEGIEYEIVKAGADKNNFDEAPIQIFNPYSEESIQENIVNQIQHLQSKGEKLSDMAILIRKGNYANSLQYHLTKAHINYVLFVEKSVFGTYDAYTVRLLLESLHDVKYKTINTFLILGKMAKIEMEHLSDEDQQDLYFRWIQWNQLADSGRIYVTIQQLLHFFAIEDQEQISNISHIAELLQEQQTQHHWSIYQCLQWLKEQIIIQNNQDYNTRVYNDADAVKIMTIHKSKGLEFDHVFILGLEDSLDVSRMSAANYKKEGKMVFNIQPFINNDKEIIEQYGNEEMRRLFYVALTRAKKSCYIYKNSKKKGLDRIYEILSTKGSIIKTHEIRNQERNSPNNDVQVTKEQLRNATKVFEKQEWYKMSFSSLSGTHSKSQIENGETTNDFDNFIFKTIGKGAYIGTKLHTLFENLPFGKLNHEEFQDLYSIFNSSTKDENGTALEINNSNNIQTLVNHIWNTRLIDTINLSLNKVNPQRVINEMEFNFITNTQIHHLHNLLQQYQNFNGFEVHLRDGIQSLKGMMNGFIDCFFEFEGRYFILDWKSNYLGNTLEHYQNENLIQAMNESNYHLQYLIYTLAIHRYLEKYIPNYDYETHFGGVLYLFVRGIREDQSTGIFFTKPAKEFIFQLNDCFENQL